MPSFLVFARHYLYNLLITNYTLTVTSARRLKRSKTLFHLNSQHPYISLVKQPPRHHLRLFTIQRLPPWLDTRARARIRRLRDLTYDAPPLPPRSATTSQITPTPSMRASKAKVKHQSTSQKPPTSLNLGVRRSAATPTTSYDMTNTSAASL